MLGFGRTIHPKPFSLCFRQGIVAERVFLHKTRAVQNSGIFLQLSRTARVSRIAGQLIGKSYDKSEPVLAVVQLCILYHPIPIHVCISERQPRQSPPETNGHELKADIGNDEGGHPQRELKGPTPRRGKEPAALQLVSQIFEEGGVIGLRFDGLG